MAMNQPDPTRPDPPTTATGDSSSVGTADGSPGDRYTLPCGNTVEQVWDDLDAGRVTIHEAGCPHCSTARVSLTQLVEATTLLAADTFDPPPGLLDQIMDAVRADLAHTAMIALPAPTGQVELSTHALASVLRFAVDRVAGLRAHRATITIDPDQPYLAHVAMTVSLQYDTGRVAAVEHARTRVAVVLTERIGLLPGRLDITVTDIWTAPPPQPGAS